MKSAGKARNNGLYRHIRTSKEIIRNLLNDSFNYTMAFTAYLLAMLPMLIIYCMGQKYIVKGLTAGSVKG